MKIGIDARSLQGPRRGQGAYAYNLIKSLLKLPGADEYVAFYNGFTTGHFAFPKETPRLKQVWCNLPGTILGRLWPRLHFPPVEYLIGGIDVFHNPANFSFTHRGPVPSQAPMVVTFNGMADPSSLWVKFDPKKLDGWFADVAANASMVISVSEMAGKDFLARTSMPQEKLRVVHLGVGGEFRPVRDKEALHERLTKYSLSGKRYLFYVGAAEPNKNLGKLLYVFSALSRSPGMEDLHLVLAGSIDDYYRKLAEKTAVLGIAQNTVFPGFVSHEDLPYLYGGAEAFVLPTITEPFGIPVLEAMACGVPAAVSKNTGALEVAGESVMTFDPLDTDDMYRCIHDVLVNNDLRSRLVAYGLERVKALTWEVTARKTLDIYKEAASMGRPA